MKYIRCYNHSIIISFGVWFLHFFIRIFANSKKIIIFQIVEKKLKKICGILLDLCYGRLCLFPSLFFPGDSDGRGGGVAGQLLVPPETALVLPGLLAGERYPQLLQRCLDTVTLQAKLI